MQNTYLSKLILNSHKQLLTTIFNDLKSSLSYHFLKEPGELDNENLDNIGREIEKINLSSDIFEFFKRLNDQSIINTIMSNLKSICNSFSFMIHACNNFSNGYSYLLTTDYLKIGYNSPT